MSLQIVPIQEVIPQTNIVVFSPHFDDFLFMLGGYMAELKSAGLLHTKTIHINILFSKSNYLAGTGEENFNNSLDRLKLATGKRLLEDQECIDEILGKFNYHYELGREEECFVRGKAFARSEMEFPHGMYEDFDQQDEAIFLRMKERIRRWCRYEDTALVFPIAFKEHIDHFIVREAAIAVAREMGGAASAVFYFQEDKPYGGIATTTERDRTEHFVNEHRLESRVFKCDPETVIDLAFRYYISQVNEVYKTGIRGRGLFLQELLQADEPCDRICIYHANGQKL